MTEPEAIFEVFGGACYEWCQLAMYRHPKDPAKVAVFDASGCSCSYWKNPTPEELAAAEPLDRTSARRYLQNFLRSNDHYINAGSAITYLDQFEHTMNAEQIPATC